MRSMLHEGTDLVPTSRTLWEIQQLAGHPPVETAANLYIDAQRQARTALDRGELRRSAVEGRESLLQYQRETRELFLGCIGGLPPPGEGQARTVKRQERESFVLESVVLPVGRGSLASANLYLPLHRQGKCPAVLVVVGHTDRGKADPEYQYLAQALVHAGFAALVLDPLGEGERFEHYEPEMDYQPIQGCSGEHDLLDWKCKLLGFSLARYFVRDGIAALDYLASREEVDPGRIALTGHSGGGTQTCMLMLAAGERFACAAPCTYVTDTQAMLECGVDPDNEMIWPGSIANGLDYIDMLAGMAPKPILLLTVQNDFFPREGTLRTFENACRLWKQAGSECPPEMVTVESQHSYTQKLSRSAADFFSRRLLERPADFSSFSFTPLPDSALWCTPDGILPKEYPHMRTLHMELADELDSCRKQRAALTPDEVKEALSRRLHLDRLLPVERMVRRVYHEGTCGHYAYHCLVWRPQEGYWNNGVLLRDMRLGDKPLPTVIALWPEGLSRLAGHSNWLHRTVRNGWQVLVMDLAASGSLLPAPLGSTMYIGWGTMFKLNAYLIQLQDSLFGLRVRQAAAAVRMLGQWDGAQKDSLRFYGEGEFARYAAYASLMTGVPAFSDGNYQPYEEIVRERYHDQTHTHEWIFPSALRLADTGEDVLNNPKLQARDPSGERPDGSLSI